VPQSKLLGSALSFTYGTPSGTSDILLYNAAQFVAATPDLSDFSSSSGLLQNVYPENKEFLYLIEEYNNSGITRQLLFTEMGLGRIQKTGLSYLLKRDYAARYYDGEEYYIASGTPTYFSPNSFLVCSSYLPETYIDVLFYSNSVLCSNNYNGPVGVDLPNNTVLGRTSGNIQSLDSNELRSVLTDANITNAVESATGNYTFLCQTLNLSNSNSRLSSAALQARPVYNTSNRPTPQRGSIIYNDQTNRFEGYDGTSWKPFAWASGIGPPYV